MRLCYYEKPTIFCRWVRSAVAVFKAWAALSRSCTILVFGVTADGVTVKVFVWAAPPAEGFWVLRSWHRSPKRSANDLTPAQRNVTLVLLAQEKQNKKTTKSRHVKNKNGKLLTRGASDDLFLRDRVGRFGPQLWFLGAGEQVVPPGDALTLQGTVSHWCWGSSGACDSLDGALLRAGYRRLQHWPGSRDVGLLGAWWNHSARLDRGVDSLEVDMKTLCWSHFLT